MPLLTMLDGITCLNSRLQHGQMMGFRQLLKQPSQKITLKKVSGGRRLLLIDPVHTHTETNEQVASLTVQRHILRYSPLGGSVTYSSPVLVTSLPLLMFSPPLAPTSLHLSSPKDHRGGDLWMREVICSMSEVFRGCPRIEEDFVGSGFWCSSDNRLQPVDYFPPRMWTCKAMQRLGLCSLTI